MIRPIATMPRRGWRSLTCFPGSPCPPLHPSLTPPLAVAAMADSDPTTDPQLQADDQVDEDQDLAVDDAADEGRQRLWIRSLTPLLQLRSHETDPSSRVQFAFDQMYVAACERVARILRSDLANSE